MPIDPRGPASTATRSIQVGGARVAYRVAGEGPAVVLLKNNTRPVDLPVAHLLSTRYRTLQIQPVGFGASERPDSYDFGSIDRQVLAVLDQENVGDFVVWGFSQTTCMAALVARATSRAVAFIGGGSVLVGHPSNAEMHRMKRDRRMPPAGLEFWRAFRQFDWHRELRLMGQPKLLYVGTKDPRIKTLRRQVPMLRGCGCDYWEFEGLDHATSGLGDPGAGGIRTTTVITSWLDASTDSWSGPAQRTRPQ